MEMHKNESKVYLVGGAVRDSVLGIQCNDMDYVIVGSSEKELIDLGFIKVGREFPVFLHPKTRDQYALADNGVVGDPERFGKNVTLVQDLQRRDLTINALAQLVLPDGKMGPVIDVVGGISDIWNRVLCHMSNDAFAQDPIRVLRVGRFLSRYSDFIVDDNTLELCRAMVARGDLDNCTRERVWGEFSKALLGVQPSRAFEFYREIGYLERHFPELMLWGIPQNAAHHPEVDTGVHVMMAIDYAASQGYNLDVLYATLMHDLGKKLTPNELLPAHHGHDAAGVPLVTAVSERLGVPTDMQWTAELMAEHHIAIHGILESRGSTILRKLMSMDAFRRPQILENVLNACVSDARGRLGMGLRKYPQAKMFLEALDAAKNTDMSSIHGADIKPANISQRIQNLRVHAILKYMGGESYKKLKDEKKVV